MGKRERASRKRDEGLSQDFKPAEIRTPDRGDGEPPSQSRPWPLWARSVVSAVLLFHIVAVLACEWAGQAVTSPLVNDLAGRFWWYGVLLHQEIAHAYFAPEPDVGTPVVTARLMFAEGKPNREIRIPDPSLRPRIRYLRQIAMAWHLVREWSGDGPSRRPIWATSFAKHLCRANPGYRRVALFVRLHRIPDLSAVVDAASRGERVDLDAQDESSAPQPIGEYSCEDL